MKAIVQDRYGPPEEVLELREIDRPEPGDGEVLVRVRASCVHPDVWHAVTGRPYVMRLMGSGFSRPKHPVPGTDVAGTVESAGRGATRFGPGDEVFGEAYIANEWRNGGAFAEYVTVPADLLAVKPSSVTFEQAAAVPTSGFIALNNLRAGGESLEGKRVLVNGAGGGVGSIALQIAGARGARVTGVDHTDKLAMLEALGADHVIDYTREDFTRGAKRYDLIFDVASNLSFGSCKRVLSPEGVYVVIGHDHFGAAMGPIFGSVPRMLRLMALSLFLKHLPKPEAPMPTKQQVIVVLREALAAGQLTPIIDRSYPLEETRRALRHLQEGRPRGKIIITP